MPIPNRRDLERVNCSGHLRRSVARRLLALDSDGKIRCFHVELFFHRTDETGNLSDITRVLLKGWVRALEVLREDKGRKYATSEDT